MNAAIAWVSKLANGAWTAVLRVLTAGLQWLADLVSLVLGLGVELIVMLLLFAVGLLQDMPEWLQQGPVPDLLVQANYFLPLGTIAACVSFYGLFYAAVYLYKAAKLVRGGG